MSVILNEVKQAEEIIRAGEVGTKPSSTLFLLGKYYRHKINLDKDATVSKLNEFMEQNYKNYNPVLWEEIIENISQKAMKYEMREIDEIGITQREIDYIKQLGNIKYEKLVFTMLCHAKLHDMISENNNGWVNTDIPEIYRLSRVTVKHRNDKFLYLNDIEQNKILGETGLISFSRKNDNLNMQINFVDMVGESVLHISDFRELGYEYLNYYKMDKFTRCECCGRLIRKTGNKIKYCNPCVRIHELERYKTYNSKRNNHK